jgi:hypothetical protein
MARLSGHRHEGGECSSVGRAPGCGLGGRGFKSLHSPQFFWGPLAQLVEQLTLNQRVWSSSLQRPTRKSPAKSRTFCGSPLPLSKRQFRGCRRHVDCLHVKMAMNSLVYVKLRDCRARCRKRDCEDIGQQASSLQKALGPVSPIARTRVSQKGTLRPAG